MLVNRNISIYRFRYRLNNHIKMTVQILRFVVTSKMSSCMLSGRVMLLPIKHPEQIYLTAQVYTIADNLFTSLYFKSDVPVRA